MTEYQGWGWFTKVLTFMGSMLLTGWIVWVVAPSEKVIYRTPPVGDRKEECRFTVGVGEKGFVEYGDYAGRVGTVQGYDNDFCNYTIKFGENTYQNVYRSNFNKIVD